MSKRDRLASLARVMSKTSAGLRARPACVSIRVAGADITLPLCSVSPFHRDRAWEQDVVLQVNVLMEISFKVREGLAQGLVADAGISRGRIAGASLAHRAQGFPRRVVLVHH